MRNKYVLILALALFSQATTVFAVSKMDAPTDNEQIVRAHFQTDGSVNLPKDFHHWVHVGTFVKESGNNLFDNSKIVAPLIANTYIEPSAYRHYMATGNWADGSQIVKEFTDAENGENCDKVSHVCKTPFGTAIFQESYTGYGYMVKDKKRFPDVAGNWAFFTTGNVKPPYPETAKVEPVSKCLACHITHASDQDYVFAAQKIGLDRTSPNNP
ncbi:cytochrome P460 family protein [Scandinavium sp. M-37]|uniref:cytochrome P460 family protein n=1 Tax=Scandinavium sp. M-37 TaxID=3373077 RepID=UPI003744D2C5